jgi:hypothetical protein
MWAWVEGLDDGLLQLSLEKSLLDDGIDQCLRIGRAARGRAASDVALHVDSSPEF